MRVRNCRLRGSMFVAALITLALLQASCFPPQNITPERRRADSIRASILRVTDIRIHGASGVASPPILRLPVDNRPGTGIGDDALTLEFEMQCDGIPNVTLELIHCDQNWVPTENVFVQDPTVLRGNDFTVARAPVGVTHYDYMLSTTFPRPGYRPQVQYAGNYIARIVDYYNLHHVLAECRFFAVETRASMGMQIYSDFYESAQTKVLQNGWKIRVDAVPENTLFGGTILGTHLYQSGQWYAPLIADQEHQSEGEEKGAPWVTWSPTILGKTTAVFGNIAGGNEHRLLDLTDVGQYPTTGNVLTTALSDIPRMRFVEYDNNGIPPDRLVALSDADYVEFQFRLDLQGKRTSSDIFVVGTFNNWIPSPEWQLQYDRITGFYMVRGLLRRALHEYQYVAGKWDADHNVLREADATLLEGNPRDASQAYYAFLYYHDNTAGGFDKIVGVAYGLSTNIR
ncbi:MAG TPA: hypothetical protein VHI13_10010 [Candidatus Kapabacteria bacterium]|nr:hypothetical protein [Candidatus Kapabacteria bacterium]